MGKIQSSIGLITGVPIADTVDQLIGIAARPRDLLASRTSQFQVERTAFTQLSSLVLGVQLAGNSLGKTSLFATKTATSSNKNLLTSTVVTDGKPAVGAYQFTPVRQASAQQLLSSTFANLTDPVGAGSLSFQRGGFVDRGAKLDQLNEGEGVQRGQIRITDRSGASAVIDLRFVRTVDDVLEAINNETSLQVVASVKGDAFRLVDSSTGSGNLAVSEVGAGTTAADLGLASIDVAASEATGDDVLRLFDDIDLSALNDGNGVGFLSALPDLEISFADGSTPLEIDFDAVGGSTELTLGAVLNTLNTADARLSAQLSAAGDRIELIDNTSGGGEFAVTGLFGSTAADDLGLTGDASGGVITGRRLLAGLKTTLVRSLQGGQGPGELGILELTDRSGASNLNVDLSGAETLDDVVSAINAAGVGIQASYNAARNGILLTDTSGGTGSLIVANGDATNTANALGIAVDASQSSVDSRSLGRQTVSRQTALSALHGGLGVDPKSFVITDTTGDEAAIKLNEIGSEITTVGGVIDAVNAAGIGVFARINDTGDGIVLVDTASGTETLSVREVGSGTTAADLKIFGGAETVDIDGTPTQVIDGTARVVVDFDAEASLQDVIDQINALDAGLVASSLFDGSQYRLSLNGEDTGIASEFLIDASDAGFSLTQLNQARDALLLYGPPESAALGVLVSSSTNEFTGVIPDVELSLKGASPGETVTVNVASTSSNIVNAANSLVEAYNLLRTQLDGLTFFDAEQDSTGILFGSGEVLRVENDLANLVTGRFFGVGSFQSLAAVGFDVDEEGQLSVDVAKLQAAFASDPDSLEQFFTDEDFGFAAKLKNVADQLAGANSSLLSSRIDALGTKIDDNTARIEFLNARLDAQRERLLLQFFRMETLVAQFQTSLSAVQNIQAIPPLTVSSG
jgi:flagellar hook-associated protein 2